MARRQTAPDRGDVVWLRFTPTQGSEQSGHRPALVLSPKRYNRRVGLALVCPITTRIKQYPFELPIDIESKDAVVLSDQLRSIDWRERMTGVISPIDDALMDQVIARISTLLFD